MALLLWIGTAPGFGSVVTDAFVDAVAQLESSGGRFTVGDGGRAQGAWQMHRGAWADVTALRRKEGQPTWTFRHAHDARVARIYARDYMRWLERQLRLALKSEPTPELIYAAYNVGLTRLAGLGYRLDRTPATTRSACARLGPLIVAIEKQTHRTLARAATE